MADMNKQNAQFYAYIAIQEYVFKANELCSMFYEQL